MFKDYFSQGAEDYQKFRPAYPNALFKYIASLCKTQELAWDCATGNGQAAQGLSAYFNKVMASDASMEQILFATRQPRIFYYAALAEASALPSQALDLITVAQAIHWFNFENFYSEVRRLLKPQGILAVWTYTRLKTRNESLRRLIKVFYWKIVGPYWPPERSYIDADYKTLPFPFREIATPEFFIELKWSLRDVLSYINTWSAVKNYEKVEKHNPVVEWLTPKALAIVPSIETLISVKMPLILKIGTVS